MRHFFFPGEIAQNARCNIACFSKKSFFGQVKNTKFRFSPHVIWGTDDLQPVKREKKCFFFHFLSPTALFPVATKSDFKLKVPKNPKKKKSAQIFANLCKIVQRGKSGGFFQPFFDLSIIDYSRNFAKNPGKFRGVFRGDRICVFLCLCVDYKVF